jgi:ElaB/YqjD/DUF883 family membrane-anchored ribosome-binding protein
MLTSVNSAAGRKDLHMGGLGADPAASLAAVMEPLVDASEDWLQKARELVRAADDYVRENPWQAVGAVALLGVTLGLVLSRRSRGVRGSDK